MTRPELELDSLIEITVTLLHQCRFGLEIKKIVKKNDPSVQAEIQS